MSVKCIGNLNITTVVGYKKFQVLVENVAYVSEVATNLLSVSQLGKNGNTVAFGIDGCRIYNREKQLIGTAKLFNDMYVDVEVMELWSLWKRDL